MYLHIGKEYVINNNDIIGIFNLDYIKNTKERKLVEELYDNRDFSMKDIIKIEYRKKVLYKDNNK